MSDIATKKRQVPDLHSGDRMTQKQFHRIYTKMPDGFKAELIGGIVYVSSPLKRLHGTHHSRLGTVFGCYEAKTPGVETIDNGTVILGDEDEPQPDLSLRILPECGGQSDTTEDDYVGGAPELLSEVASSSWSIDLHAKKDQYAANGVREYVVINLRDQEVRWFDLTTGEEFDPDTAGVYRSIVFPGLWLDAEALFKKDYRRLLDVLEQGLATPEHAAFVKKLAAARAARKKRK